MKAVVLAGGTGGAKFARGAQDLGTDIELSVIANTGDDVRALGVLVSPDPDLVTYWLADQIDAERGWGIRDDTFTVFERLVELGAPDWFALSDRDLATCLRRTAMIDRGARLTEAQAEIVTRLGVEAAVLPMCDEPVRTRVRTPKGWIDFQEFLILERAKPPVEDVALDGIEGAAPTREVTAAIAAADAIVIGPSNPVISIGPILAVPGMRDLLREAAAPIVAVSPFVAGRAVKGPTEQFMAGSGQDVSAAGVAALYADLIDAIVIDEDDPEEPPEGVVSLGIPTLMDRDETRRMVAERTLGLAQALEA